MSEILHQYRRTLNYVWDPIGLEWVAEEQPATTSGGGGGGSGTEYTEDAASAANPIGGMLIVRRRDTLNAAEVTADNDNIAVNATAKGEVYVKHTDSIPVTDNGGSITIDGSVTNLANDGVDIGDVTINNAAGASAVNIQDGGNSITVDGSVTATLAAGAATVGKVDQGVAGSLLSGWPVRIVDSSGSSNVPSIVNGLTNPSSGTQGLVIAANSRLNDYLGTLTETAPATDTASSGLNGRLQRVAQRITSLIALVPAALTGSGNFKVAVQEALPAGANSIGTVDTELTTADLDTGAGTDTRAVVGLVYAESGGGTLVSMANPLPVSAVTGSITSITTVGTITNVVHVDDNAGSLTVDNPVLSVVGGGTEAAAQRVTIASDSTGVLSVDDNGGNLSIDDGGNSITVDGSVTVTQATGTNLHTVVDSGTISTITNVVHVDDNAGSLTIDNANLDVALSTRLKAADTLAAVTTVGTITNVVHVDDNAGSLTVDGTIAVSKTDLTPSAPTAASVGVASAQAVAASATRKGLILVNTSNARISLGFGSAAVLDSGVTLYPSGIYCMGEYDFDLGAVNAIASVAASNLAIQEYTT